MPRSSPPRIKRVHPRRTRLADVPAVETVLPDRAAEPVTLPEPESDLPDELRRMLEAAYIPRLRENLGLLSLQDRRGLIRLAHERPVSRPLGPDASAGDDAPADAEYGAPADERAAAARRRLDGRAGGGGAVHRCRDGAPVPAPV